MLIMLCHVGLWSGYCLHGNSVKNIHSSIETMVTQTNDMFCSNALDTWYFASYMGCVSWFCHLEFKPETSQSVGPVILLSMNWNEHELSHSCAGPNAYLLFRITDFCTSFNDPKIFTHIYLRCLIKFWYYQEQKKERWWCYWHLRISHIIFYSRLSPHSGVMHYSMAKQDTCLKIASTILWTMTCSRDRLCVCI